MRRLTTISSSLLLSVFALTSASIESIGQEFNNMPRNWKWLDNEKVALSYDGSFTDSAAFAVNATNHKITTGIKAPAKYTEFPANPEGAVNLTFSPDSSKLAFTRDNDLYVYDIQTDSELRLTYDGSETILNGYASWVYYEEILGRPSKYKAFWWSPDSKKSDSTGLITVQ